MHNTESDSTVGCGEIEKELKNTLAFLSGAQMGSNHEKIEVKNLMTHTL